MKYTILASLVPMFEEKLQKFQKKFAKYGQGSIIYEKSDKRYVNNKLDPYYQHYVVDIEVEGKYQVSGYEFVASLEWNDELQLNTVRKAPETADIPTKYVTRNECDHCKTNRYRKYTVLLKNIETDEYVQVGNSCVKDYIGCDITDYAAYLGIWKSLEDYIESLNREKGSSDKKYYTPISILDQTCAEVRNRSYVSKRQVERWYEEHEGTEEYCPFNSTASRIFTMFGEVIDDHGKPVVPFYEITNEDEEFAETVIQFINENKDSSDYIRNIYIAINSKHVGLDNVALIASAVGSYLRVKHQKEEEARKTQESTSEYVGKVGDKVTVTATPKCVYSCESDYGMFYIYEFDVEGNKVIWKTSKRLEEVELTIKGTVVATKEYRGIKQTELKNCRKIS